MINCSVVHYPHRKPNDIMPKRTRLGNLRAVGLERSCGRPFQIRARNDAVKYLVEHAMECTVVNRWAVILRLRRDDRLEIALCCGLVRRLELCKYSACIQQGCDEQKPGNDCYFHLKTIVNMSHKSPLLLHPRCSES